MIKPHCVANYASILHFPAIGPNRVSGHWRKNGFHRSRSEHRGCGRESVVCGSPIPASRHRDVYGGRQLDLGRVERNKLGRAPHETVADHSAKSAGFFEAAVAQALVYPARRSRRAHEPGRVHYPVPRKTMTSAALFSEQDVRLIPKPLWGYSLASLCLASSWNGVRDHALQALPGGCRYQCLPGTHSGTIEAHERWRYDLNGRVVLEAIWPLCRACHELFHPGRVLAHRGQAGLERLTQRYAAAAGIGRSEAWRRYAEAFRVHSEASKIRRWSIDTTSVAPHFPLKVKRNKRSSLASHTWVPDPF